MWKITEDGSVPTLRLWCRAEGGGADSHHSIPVEPGLRWSFRSFVHEGMPVALKEGIAVQTMKPMGGRFILESRSCGSSPPFRQWCRCCVRKTVEHQVQVAIERAESTFVASVPWGRSRPVAPAVA